MEIDKKTIKDGKLSCGCIVDLNDMRYIRYCKKHSKLIYKDTMEII